MEEKKQYYVESRPFVKISLIVGIFGLTQIPIAIIEGLLTVVVLNLLSDHVPMRFEFLSQYKKRGWYTFTERIALSGVEM